MSDPSRETSSACCGLPPEDLEKRRDELRSGLATRITAAEELDDGYRLRFRRTPEIIAEIGEFIAFESRCCSFMSYALEVVADDPEVILSLTGPEGTKDLWRAVDLGADPTRPESKETPS